MRRYLQLLLPGSDHSALLASTHSFCFVSCLGAARPALSNASQPLHCFVMKCLFRISIALMLNVLASLDGGAGLAGWSAVGGRCRRRAPCCADRGFISFCLLLHLQNIHKLSTISICNDAYRAIFWLSANYSIANMYIHHRTSLFSISYLVAGLAQQGPS